jgi:F0F1-type ATP synthase assembly protein I
LGFFITFILLITPNKNKNMKLRVLILFALLLSSVSFTQETTFEDTSSIENQFEELYKKSSTYQVYKVISKDKYQRLKLNILDSLKDLKETIAHKESLLLKEKSNIEETKKLLTQTEIDLNISLKKESSIDILGIKLSKVVYNLLLWGIIVLLLLGLSYFIFKFFRSNVLTKEAKNNLVDVEQEFEQHRKKTLVREQKLRRKLQDEINKQRNS